MPRIIGRTRPLAPARAVPQATDRYDFSMRIARIQALITWLWLACALGWLILHWDAPARAWLGALAIAGSQALVLGLEFLAQRWVSRSDPAPRATAVQLLQAWAREVPAALALFCWQQPFRSRRHPDALGPEHQGRRGILLVHGYVCNRGVWNPWMERLRAQGVPFLAIDLEPPFAGLDAHVPAIESAVARLTQVTGLPPLLVGHSMGGLVLRAWLAHAAAPERVHRLVTLGSPHQGTWLARWAHTRNGRQMRPRSPWLQALVHSSQGAWHRHFVCFYSNADPIVFPPSHATLDGADNRLLQGLAHVEMAWTPEVVQAVLALREAPALA